MYNTGFIRSHHRYEPFDPFSLMLEHNSVRIYSISPPTSKDQHDVFVGANCAF